MTDLALSPDGNMLALARVKPGSNRHPEGEAYEAEVEIREAATGRSLRILDQTSLLSPQSDLFNRALLKRIAFAPDGRRLATVDAAMRPFTGESAEPTAATVRVWDVGGGKVFQLDKAGEQVAFSPEGRWIATLAVPRPGKTWSGGAVRFWEASTGEPAFTFDQTDEQGRNLRTYPGASMSEAGLWC